MNSPWRCCLNGPQYIIVYPISQGNIINVTGFHTQERLENTAFTGSLVKGINKAEFFGPYSHWEPEVQALLKVRTSDVSRWPFTMLKSLISQCVERLSQWAIHTSKPLNSVISGRVVLLGDAASYCLIFFVYSPLMEVPSM
jgi:salicylate hydroxylase